jgi:sugar O-acyltransferase (sialic acid O-acetyltransferase NeuD family)
VTVTRRLIVYGAGGHGKVVADIGRSMGFAIAAFVDDGAPKIGTTFFGAPVLSWERLIRDREKWADAVMGLGIGDNTVREHCFWRICAAGVPVVTLVHPTAVLAPSARLGVGTVVMACAVVNPDAVVGDGAILNTGSIVEHDNRLARFVHLSPNVALGGNVCIGDRTHLGLGAVVLPGVRVGADVRVGAGAVVHRPVVDGLTIVGVPARPIVINGERR